MENYIVEMEDYRVKNIATLMSEASELRITTNQKHKLYHDIYGIITCFGLWETAEKKFVH